MARGDILQVVVFATFFGVALAAIGREGQPVLEVLESIAQVMFKFTGYVMKFAPIGVMAAIAATVGGKGLGDPVHARQAGALMYLGCAIFVLIVVGGVVVLIRVPFFTFVRGDPRAVPDRVHHRELAKPRCPRRSR